MERRTIFPVHTTIFVALTLVTYCHGANILCLMGVPSHSHHIWNRALMEALAKQGHNLTIVSPDMETTQKPNITYIYLEKVYQAVHEGDSAVDFYEMAQQNMFLSTVTFYDYGMGMCEGIMKSKGLDIILNYPNDFKFDLVLYDFSCGPCLMGLYHKFGEPPLVGVTAFNIPPYTTDVIGGHKYPSYIPYYSLSYDSEMNFWQRLENTFIYVFDHLYRNYRFLPKTDELVRKHPAFRNVPYLPESDKKMMLLLANSHHAVDFPEPVPQNMILVGGLQLIPPKPLPQDLEKFITAAPKGAILFSLGTNVLSSDLGDERIAMFLEAMAHFPEYNFLWKFETEMRKFKLPKNLLLRKFLPQNDILAHPNIKLFMTHAGLLSTHEATWHGVPIIGIPFIADQYRNLEKSMRAKVAERLNVFSLTTNDIVQTIRKVLEDPGYRNRMQEKSALFRDQPERPLDRAIWWIEWALRHPNAKSIQSPTMKLGFWRSQSYDVVLFIVVVILAIRYLLKKLFTSDVKSSKKAKAKMN
ncbi:UDP-glucosyltransferase 2-like [Uranotaenia lowii]|uniref:UDP-glucosyltransferase 2-like n=1 Tax=Uranotaenia lowii TaxID=190385 RepID=UPI00247AA968|nr:UDP-glucosyltransferase 2-like [Uranotaenia lowii]